MGPKKPTTTSTNNVKKTITKTTSTNTTPKKQQPTSSQSDVISPNRPKRAATKQFSFIDPESSSSSSEEDDEDNDNAIDNNSSESESEEFSDSDDNNSKKSKSKSKKPIKTTSKSPSKTLKLSSSQQQKTKSVIPSSSQQKSKSSSSQQTVSSSQQSKKPSSSQQTTTQTPLQRRPSLLTRIQQEHQQQLQPKKIDYNLKNKLNTEKLNDPNYLDVSQVDTSKLIVRLKKLDQFLRDKDCTKELLTDNIVDSLANTELINNKNVEIKIMTCCCISEIFRILAPTVPYDRTVLVNIIDIFIELVLSPISKDSKLYTQYFHLLERLDSSKVFSLLPALDNEKLTQFFKDTFTRVQSGKINSVMESLLSKFLGSILESIEEMSVELWDLILGSLLESTSGRETPRSMFARELIDRHSLFLKPHFSIYLKEMEDPECTTVLRNKKYSIILAMYLILPEFIFDELEQLEIDLDSPSKEKRRDIVSVLSRIYQDENAGDILSARPTLYETFLNRFYDAEPKVRHIMMDFARNYTPETSQEMEKILMMVHARFRDAEADIRSLAISIFTEYITKMPELINKEMMGEFLERVRDKENSVRKDAVVSLSLVWKSVREKNGPIQDWPENLIDNFGSIPKTLFLCLGLYDDDKYRAEVAVDTILLPSHSDVKNRSLVFIEIYQSLDEHTRELFFKYLEEKKTLQTEFMNLVRYSRESTKDKSELNTYLTNVDNLIPKFSHENTVKLLKQLLSSQNKKVLDLLSNVFDINTNFQTQFQIKMQILSKAQKSDSFSEFIKYLVYRLSFSMVGKENVKYILRSLREDLGVEKKDEIDDFSEKVYDKEIKNIPETLDLIVKISTVYPNIFEDHGTDIVSFLTTSKSILVGILQVLINISHCIKLPKQTLKLCEVPSPHIAKLAFKALVKLLGDKEIVSVLTDLTDSLVSSLLKKSKNILSILERMISKSYFSIMNNYIEDVELFVIKTIMTGTCNLEVSKKSISKQDVQYSNDALLKMHGLRFLGNYLVGLPRDKIIQKSFETVQMIFDYLPKFEKNKSYTEIEKYHLKLTTCLSLFKILQKQPFEQKITPQQFSTICNMASEQSKLKSDPLLKQFFTKLTKYMRLNRIPLRYMCTFGMAAQQPNYILTIVRKSATSIIKTRRMALSRLPPNVPLRGEFYPEASMPYFVYLISNRPDFEDDAPEYTYTSFYINFFVDLMVEESDNHSILQAMFQAIKRSSDKLNPDSQNILITADLGLLILTQQYQYKKWKPQKHPAPISLPTHFYEPNPDADEQKSFVDHLTGKFKLPTLPKPHLQEEEQKQTEEKSEEAGEGQTTTVEETPKTTPKKSPAKRRRKAKKVVVSSEEEDEEEEEDDEEEEEEEEEVIKKPTKRVATSKSRTIHKKKEESSDEEEEEEEEEEKSKKSNSNKRKSIDSDQSSEDEEEKVKKVSKKPKK
eukprot:gene5370-6701_t